MKNKTTGRAVDAGRAAGKAINSAAKAGASSFYDTKSGVLLMTVLALVLWWIPYLGQMIPGYVGGRRGGSVSRGVLTAVLGAITIVALTAGGALALSWLVSTPTIADAIASYPFVQDLVDRASAYLAEFVTVSEAGFSVEAGNYVLMGVFSVLGGAMANQSRKELSLIIDAVAAKNAPKVPRSVKAAASGRSLSFESYSDLATISVNSMAGADLRSSGRSASSEQPEHRKAQEPAPRAAEPAPQVTSTQVSATDSIPSVNTTSTSYESRTGSMTVSDAGSDTMAEQNRPSEKRRPAFNDYEYL